MTTKLATPTRGKNVDSPMESGRSDKKSSATQYVFSPSATTPEPPERLDRWGFATTEDEFKEKTNKLTSEEENLKRRKENERLEKWLKMKERWESESDKKKKRRCRKGIPDAMRGTIWMLLSGADKLKDSNPGLYNELKLKEADPEAKSVIERDLERTFPSHDLFKRQSQGQNSLRHVLIAYACYDREIGYCQGMGFIATLFLMYCQEENAFWLLVAVLSDEGKYKLRGSFSQDLWLTQQRCAQLENLVEQLLPRLYEHFQEEKVNPFLYSSKWFMTIFTYNFPFEAVVRIWDVFLNEGVKIIFRVGLQCLKNDEEKLLELEGGPLFSFCTSMHTRVDPDTIIEQAMKLKLTRAHIQAAEDDYKKEKDDDELKI